MSVGRLLSGTLIVLIILANVIGIGLFVVRMWTVNPCGLFVGVLGLASLILLVMLLEERKWRRS